MPAHNYEPVIGIEVHARMNTETKLFSRSANIPLPEQPNSTVTAFDMGFPGMLPVLNKEALHLGVRASLSLGCTVRERCKFDRKNYFYPDLPCGYQISQFDEPLAEEGSVTIELSTGTKDIRVERLHLENDAGKLTHIPGATLCDYNRSGAPLMEIVSGPDMRSIEEASSYAQELQKILRASGASDCDMEKGMMRFDVNISLRPIGREEFGTKVEIKNLNSFRSLELAIAFEVERQSAILDEGGKIIQETRGWHDDRQETLSQRSKEVAADYRYFPEPDLPPVVIAPSFIENIRATLPELPLARKQRLMDQYQLDMDTARIFTADYELANLFETVAEKTKNPKSTASWISSILIKYLNDTQISVSTSPVTPEHMAFFVSKVDEGALSNLQAKEVFEEFFATGKDPQTIVDEKGFKQVSDVSELRAICEQVIADNPTQLEQFKSGKDKLFGFFVGQTMKATKGQGNPNVIHDLLQELLNG